MSRLKLRGKPMVMTDSLKEQIQNHPTLTVLRHAVETDFDKTPRSKTQRDIPLPIEFNGAQVWGEMLTPVVNQGKCGSCWAFSTTSALADRFNIQSLGVLHIQLSPAKLVLCNFQGKDWEIAHPESDPASYISANITALQTGACHGNTLYDAWRYLYVVGAPLEKCVPYDQSVGPTFNFSTLSSFTDEDRIPLCTAITGPLGDMCSDFAIDIFSGEEYGTPARFFRAKHIYSVAGVEKDGGSEENIRREIFTWGPVTSGYVMYPDFYTFNAKKDIYKWNGYGEPVGGHAVEIVGWGEENGHKYWWIKNSWGTEWGINGYFRMDRGNNDCLLEENVIASIPDFFYPIGYDFPNPDNFEWTEDEESQDRKWKLGTNLSMPGGGMDPQTGYVRRIIATKPWVDITTPIDYTILPDWNTFVAGIDAQKEKRYAFQRKIRALEAENGKNSCLGLYVSMSIIIVLCVLLVVLCLRK